MMTQSFPSSAIKNADPELLRIERQSLAELPSTDYLVRLMERAEWVMLQVPSTIIALEDYETQDILQEEKNALIAEISARLPEYKVWDCHHDLDNPGSYGPKQIAAGTRRPGLSRIGIRRVITEKEIVEHLSLFLHAIRRYGELATSLMTRLATHQGIELSTLSASEFPRPSHGHFQPRGQLPTSPDFPELWAYFFHGADCMFTSRDGIIIEARLGFGAECGNYFGAIEPGFLLWYLQSDAAYNPESAQLANLLRNWTENASRTIDSMERNSLIRHISSAHDIGRGWILTESNSQES